MSDLKAPPPLRPPGTPRRRPTTGPPEPDAAARRRRGTPRPAPPDGPNGGGRGAVRPVLPDEPTGVPRRRRGAPRPTPPPAEVLAADPASPVRALRAPRSGGAEGTRPLRAPADGRPDPRIVARRVAVQRDAGRRRLRRLLWVLGAAAVVALAALATRSPLLDLDTLAVSGEGVAPDLIAAVEDAARTGGAEPGTPLLDVDPAAVAAAVGALPGVAAADVARDWPGGLRIEVTPRLPVARVGQQLVADDGTVVGTGPGPGLVELTGLGTDLGSDRARAALAVATALTPDLRPQVATVRARPGDQVELVLVAGGVARLGPAEDLADKLTAVATVLARVDLACLATLDVRVPSAPAITRAAGCGP